MHWIARSRARCEGDDPSIQRAGMAEPKFQRNQSYSQVHGIEVSPSTASASAG